MIATFCGHREVYAKGVYEKVLEFVKDLVINKGVDTFYSGNMGEFDKLCEKAVRALKREHDIKLYWVAPYLTSEMNKEKSEFERLYDGIIIPDFGDAHYKAVILKRNFWMVDKSEYVISYVYREFGGAYKTLKYAQKTGKSILSADVYET
ncbi:MAG: DUF1273 domain-containing protein [Clostridia bacterium]|nr:DUF1273 domain-containing protein [Clostridia bacterium]